MNFEDRSISSDKTARLCEGIFFVAAQTGGMAVAGVLVFMVYTGLPLLGSYSMGELLIGSWSPVHHRFGIFPMVVGTLCISLLSTLMAFPLCIGCAAYISVLGNRTVAGIIKRMIQMMTGIPTVIYGFAGIFLLVPVIRELFMVGSGMCILSTSLMLSLLIAPTMVLLFVQSFDAIPETWCRGVDALGGTSVQKLIHIIIPFSIRGIAGGLILSLGRALGDTLIALMIAGNAVQIPSSVLDSVRSLTTHIALVTAADFDSMEFKSIFLCGALLYLITAIIILGVRAIHRSTDAALNTRRSTVPGESPP